MDYAEKIAKAQDAVTVRRVYGEPYAQNGVTLIPAAQVAGGGGAGGGEDPNGGGSGGGGGFGIVARPVGAYVIRGDEVRWQPAVDVSRLLAQLTVAALGLALLPRRARLSHATTGCLYRHAAGPWTARELALHPASSPLRSDRRPVLLMLKPASKVVVGAWATLRSPCRIATDRGPGERSGADGENAYVVSLLSTR
jgi:Sporulation protein YtfJ (Spore_YtfJ)